MVYKGIARFFITILILTLTGIGLVNYLKHHDENECSMTYMRQSPSLIPVQLSPAINRKFPFYKLYLYCEGYDCQKYENLHFTAPGSIPVLFITGNADSHKQVRSLASISIDKSLHLKPSNKIKFHYFTISFNEELSALYGPILQTQTDYAKHCIVHILSLFKNIKPESSRPTSVLVIGNSMGGVVSRGLLVPSSDDDDFHKKNLVHTIITEASPHVRPVANLDKPLSDFYDKINNFWLNKSEDSLKEIVLASLYGGTRDFHVRSGLANINEWKNKSPATIISSYTVSMPHVWRSVDHRCMAWCRELIMAINRALFEMVDSTTGQITQDKSKREKILKYHFERDVDFSLENTKTFKYDQIDLVNDKSKSFFEFNGFNPKNKLVVFNIENSFDKEKHDSLFIYTNINTKNGFLLCKDFVKLNENENECQEPYDLMSNHGRSVPPYLEDARLKSTLRIINVIDFKKIIQEKEFKYMLLDIPVVVKKSSNRQIVVKLDWYLKKERFQLIETPSLTNPKEIIEFKTGTNNVFTRLYMPRFNNILQGYNLNKIQQLENPNNCDSMIIKDSESKSTPNQLPMSASTVFIQFYEPTSLEQAASLNEHVYHSQAIQGKNKNLILLLTANQLVVKETTPYIDIIQFDIKHLLHHTSLNNKNLDSCSSEFGIELEINYFAILGQFVRFYMVLLPAFIVCIIQFYDYLIIRAKSSHSDNELNSFFILNKFNTCFSYHLMYSLILTILCYLIQLDLFEKVINQIDAERVFILRNDFELIKQQRLSNFFLAFILYWCAYGVLSVATFFLSFIISIISAFYHRILKKFGIFEISFVHGIIAFVHLVVTVCGCVLASTISHCFIFYGEIIQLVVRNPRYEPANSQINQASLKSYQRQTRVLLVYLLLILNLPALIVWSKSFKDDNIQPLFSTIGDCGLPVAIASIILYIISYIKDKINFLREKIFQMNDNLLANLVIMNSLLTVLYSSLNLYKLHYFIIIHLFLMCFNSMSNISTQKPKRE